MIDLTTLASGLRRRLDLDAASFYLTASHGSTGETNRATIYLISAMLKSRSQTFTKLVHMAGPVPTMADLLEAVHGAYQDARAQECHCCGFTKNWPEWAQLEQEMIDGF